MIPAGEGANTASTLQAFKAVADNAFTRSILKALAPDPGYVRNKNAWQIVQLNIEARKGAGSGKIAA